jgi:predicted transcriptional regulator of viral defense system
MILQDDNSPKLNLYKIRDMAVNSGRAIFNISQLANLLGVKKEMARLYSSRLVKKGLANRILRGYISFTDNNFIIATQLIEPSYISLNSALLFHGIIKQIPVNVQAITTINSKLLQQWGLEYHRIQPTLFFGYERVKIENSYVFMASPEKALIDGLYLHLFTTDFIQENVTTLNFNQMKKRLSTYKGYNSSNLKEMIKLLTQRL